MTIWLADSGIWIELLLVRAERIDELRLMNPDLIGAFPMYVDESGRTYPRVWSGDGRLVEVLDKQSSTRA